MTTSAETKAAELYEALAAVKIPNKLTTAAPAGTLSRLNTVRGLLRSADEESEQDVQGLVSGLAVGLTQLAARGVDTLLTEEDLSLEVIGEYDSEFTLQPDGVLAELALWFPGLDELFDKAESSKFHQGVALGLFILHKISQKKFQDHYTLMLAHKVLPKPVLVQPPVAPAKVKDPLLVLMKTLRGLSETTGVSFKFLSVNDIELLQIICPQGISLHELNSLAAPFDEVDLICENDVISLLVNPFS